MSLKPAVRADSIVVRSSAGSHIDTEVAIIAGSGAPVAGETITTPAGQAFGAAQPVIRIDVAAAAEGDMLLHYSPDGGATWFELLAVGAEVS